MQPRRFAASWFRSFAASRLRGFAASQLRGSGRQSCVGNLADSQLLAASPLNIPTGAKWRLNREGLRCETRPQSPSRQSKTGKEGSFGTLVSQGAERRRRWNVLDCRRTWSHIAWPWIRRQHTWFGSWGLCLSPHLTPTLFQKGLSPSKSM